MILYLIFIANNLMQLFLIRWLKKNYETQKEMVGLLLKGLYLLKYRADWVYDILRKKTSGYGTTTNEEGRVCPSFII